MHDLISSICTEDVIFLVSDGVYDNVDPEHLGLTPAQVFEPDSLGAKFSEWDAIPIDICVEKKERFKIDRIRSLYPCSCLLRALPYAIRPNRHHVTVL